MELCDGNMWGLYKTMNGEFSSIISITSEINKIVKSRKGCGVLKCISRFLTQSKSINKTVWVWKSF